MNLVEPIQELERLLERDTAKRRASYIGGLPTLREEERAAIERAILGLTALALIRCRDDFKAQCLAHGQLAAYEYEVVEKLNRFDRACAMSVTATEGEGA